MKPYRIYFEWIIKINSCFSLFSYFSIQISWLVFKRAVESCQVSKVTFIAVSDY